MQLTRHSTRKWNVFALFIMALAISVFAWGLKYKLSLYESAVTPAHPISVAKLLSNRERPADTVQKVERAVTPALLLVILSTFFASQLLDQERQSRWTLQRVQNGQRRVLPPYSRQVFSRPPPRRK